jgi:hypothetical protein
MAEIVDELEEERVEPSYSWSQRLAVLLTPRGGNEPAIREGTLDDPLDDEERALYMKSVSALERRWSRVAFLLGVFGGVIVAGFVLAKHPTTNQTLKLTGGLPWSVGTKTEKVKVSDVYVLAGSFVAVLGASGLLALRFRKRSLVIFCLFFLGLAFTWLYAILGLAFIFLGGWMLLRSWRVQRHGVASGKAAAQASAQKRAELRGQKTGTKPAARSSAAKTTTPRTTRKPATSTAERKAPTPSKRYTPKAPVKKKIPKPT